MIPQPIPQTHVVHDHSPVSHIGPHDRAPVLTAPSNRPASLAHVAVGHGPVGSVPDTGDIQVGVEIPQNGMEHLVLPSVFPRR